VVSFVGLKGVFFCVRGFSFRASDGIWIGTLGFDGVACSGFTGLTSWVFYWFDFL
jgi:hypothetical protein